MEWFGREYGIISDGVVTVGIRTSVCTGVIRLILITWFTVKLAKIVWILKIRWIVKEWSRSRGPRGNFGFLKNLWFILLTSNTLLYVRLTFLHNQTRWATCFIRVLFRITGIARVDGLIHSTDPIFASGYELWCRHVYHTCAFCMSTMRGKDTLHSNGGCPRLDAVHAAVGRMDTISIVNGNVCGRFHDMLARKVRFLQVH
jgi:hypothetical protein